MRDAHRERYGTTDDLLVGLQLSHSGRYCRPDQDFLAKPRIAYRHPLLDERSGVHDDRAILSDMELDDLVGDFVVYAKFAHEAGFDFVDVKQCHAYLLHEMLSAHTRPGRYGGSFENRTRLFREIVTAIRRDVPALLLGTRVSIFDMVPFQKPPGDPGGVGEPMPHRAPAPLPLRIRGRPGVPDGAGFHGAAPAAQTMRRAGCPVYQYVGRKPLLQPPYPASGPFPPCDGYWPPEDPLVGCARQIEAVARCKRAFPHLVLVGTGYSYLQEYLAHVAQAQVRLGHVDFVGVGGWLSPIRTTPTISCTAAASPGSASAGPTATAPPPCGTAWSLAVTRTIPSTRGSPKPRSCGRSSTPRPGPEAEGAPLA